MSRSGTGTENQSYNHRSCLLGLSLLALGGTLIYNKIANTTPATVTVPDNLITLDEDATKPDSGDSQAPDSSETPSDTPMV